jgi:hypothetical protein
LVGVWMAVPARICTLYVVTDLRELLAGRRLSLLAAPGAVVCAGPEVAPVICSPGASSYTSTACSILVDSDSTLASSPRLVGGVEMDGDALDMARASACLSVRTVMFDRVEDVEVGERSRSAMVAEERRYSARRGRGLEGRGTDAQRRSTVWADQGAHGATVPKFTRGKASDNPRCVQ